MLGFNKREIISLSLSLLCLYYHYLKDPIDFGIEKFFLALSISYQYPQSKLKFSKVSLKLHNYSCKGVIMSRE